MPATTKHSSRCWERKWTSGPCLGALTVGEEADTKAGSNQWTQAVGKWLEDAWSPLGDRGQGSNEITQIPTCHQDQMPLA